MNPNILKKIQNLIIVPLFFLFLHGCSSPPNTNIKKESYEDYSNPAKTLQTFFKAGHEGREDIIARCFLDWDNVIAMSTGYKNFIEHIRIETSNMNYRLFKVGRKDELLELGIEIISQKPYFRRRDFYYFDHYKGRWLIVTSGWMKDLGCG